MLDFYQYLSEMNVQLVCYDRHSIMIVRHLCCIALTIGDNAVM